MKERSIQRNSDPSDMGRLAARLKPIRTHREVAALLGLSPSVVLEAETSALRKIVRALTRLEDDGDHEA